MAQDHAEQEFHDGLTDLLHRLATHPSAPPTLEQQRNNRLLDKAWEDKNGQ